MLKTISELETKSKHIRKLILDMCIKAGTGHVNSAYSAVEILTALYYGGIMRFDPKNPNWEKRDRFILSKGQASVLLYPILADLGYFSINELEHFAQEKGKFGVHLQHDVPGAEITSGSLGHGFGFAAGVALAAKLNQENYMTFALLGDGECYEGSIWETAMFASYQRLNNLIAIVDRNWLCATNFTENILSLEPLDEKWESFGWRVKRIDGNSFEDILDAFKGFRSRRDSKPLVIISETTKGKGVSFMSDAPLWHSLAPEGEEADQAKKEIDKGLILF